MGRTLARASGDELQEMMGQPRIQTTWAKEGKSSYPAPGKLVTPALTRSSCAFGVNTVQVRRNLYETTGNNAFTIFQGRHTCADVATCECKERGTECKVGIANPKLIPWD